MRIRICRNPISLTYSIFCCSVIGVAYATILILMLRTNKNFYKSRSNEILGKLFTLIEDAIVRGQKDNIFRKDLDLGLCRDLLFGTLDHIMIPWIMFSRGYDMRSLGVEVSDLFVNALRA